VSGDLVRARADALDTSGASITITAPPGNAPEPAIAFGQRPTVFVANLGSDGCHTVESSDVMYPEPGPPADVESKYPDSAKNCGYAGTCKPLKGNGGGVGSGAACGGGGGGSSAPPQASSGVSSQGASATPSQAASDGASTSGPSAPTSRPSAPTSGPSAPTSVNASAAASAAVTPAVSPGMKAEQPPSNSPDGRGTFVRTSWITVTSGNNLVVSKILVAPAPHR
jgi:hypothetical protein